MRLVSEAWANGEPIPERFAAGRLEADGTVGFSDDLSPPLSWTGLPAGTQSLALLCQDFDEPESTGGFIDEGHDGHDGREWPADAPRVDFFHWVLVDLPPDVMAVSEGQWSRGFTARGKRGPDALFGARQGLNDFTQRFMADAALSGQYFGYDGPLPPGNDALVHHIVFTLYALSVPRLAVAGAFTGVDALRALAEHVLGSATHSGTYTLNRRLRGAAR